MERYNLCVVLVSLVPPSPAVLLADPQWTSSDKHTCSHMETMSHWSSAGSLRGACPASAQTSNWHSETQISSLEFSPSCHHVARWKRKAWYLDTRGFIPKKIQWHIHAGSWSLVNCWREWLMLPYIGCSWILMTAAVGLKDGLGLDSNRCIRVIPRQFPDLNGAFKNTFCCVSPLSPRNTKNYNCHADFSFKITPSLEHVLSTPFSTVVLKTVVLKRENTKWFIYCIHWHRRVIYKW